MGGARSWSATGLTDRKSVMMIRVKVNSKSEIVEDREGKSALYGVICDCDNRLLSRAVVCGHQGRAIRGDVMMMIIQGFCLQI